MIKINDLKCGHRCIKNGKCPICIEKDYLGITKIHNTITQLKEKWIKNCGITEENYSEYEIIEQGTKTWLVPKKDYPLVFSDFGGIQRINTRINLYPCFDVEEVGRLVIEKLRYNENKNNTN